MKLPHLSVAAALLAAFFFTSALAAQGLEGEEIAKDKSYDAGTRIKSTAVGISVKVPDGLKASLSPNGAALLLKGEGKVGVLFLRTGLTTGEVKQRFSEEMDLTFLDENAYLERSGEPAVDGKKLTATYSGDEIAGFAQAEIGEKGQGYAIVVAAASAETAKTAVTGLAGSVAWAAPQAEKEVKALREQLEGQRLSLSSEEGSITCDLAKDGSYALTVKAGDMEQGEKGKWSAEYGVLCGTLVLASSAGEIKGLTVVIEGNEAVVDGTRFKRAPLAGGTPEKPTKETPKVEEPSKETPKAEQPKDEGKQPRPAEAADKGKVRKVEADPNWKTDIKEVEKLEGEELQYNVPVVGEKRVKTDFLGVSFVVQAGMKGACDGKAPVFAIGIEGKFGLGLVFMQTGVNNAATAVALLSEEQDLGEGIVLKPEGKAKIEGGKVTQEFRSENHCARAVIVIGPSGNSLGVTFIGPKEDHERLAGYVEAIVKSAQFAKPKAEEKRAGIKKDMGGKVFHIYRYKQAGSGSNISGWETKIWYHFGSDGTIHYIYQFSGDHYVKGTDGGGNTTHTGGAWSNNNQAVNGTWRIEFNMTGIVLILKADSGEESVHMVRLEGSKVFLNDEEVGVSKSDKKD